MQFYNDATCSIIFGDAKTSIDPTLYKNRNQTELLQLNPFKQWQSYLDTNAFIFAHQIHGINGFVITNENQIADYNTLTYPADFLITSIPGIALGILTADCLPIVMYDVQQNIIALIHAGWRGTVACIAQIAAEQMISLGCRKENMRIFFGPSANACCYEVRSEVIEIVSSYSWAQQALIKRERNYYFDKVFFNRLLFQELGFPESSFIVDYNDCTMENSSYISHRRDKSTKRQITLVTLHKRPIP